MMAVGPFDFTAVIWIYAGYKRVITKGKGQRTGDRGQERIMPKGGKSLETEGKIRGITMKE